MNNCCRQGSFRVPGFSNVVTGISYGMGEAASGVPLGGLGTGSVRLCTDGTFRQSSLENRVRDRIDCQDSCFFAVWTKDSDRKVAKLLQKATRYRFSCLKDLRYVGHFPFVDIDYDDGDLPVNLHLQAFSPFIPGHSQSSATPAAIFTFHLTNKSNCQVDASIAFSWRNSHRQRAWEAVSLNQFQSQGGLQGISYSQKDSKDSYSLIFLDDPDVELTYLAGWDILGNGQDFWTPFSETGELPNTNSKEFLACPRFAGALAAKLSLKPDEEKKVTFILSWYMPEFINGKGEFLGHAYTNWFSDSWNVAEYVVENKEYLYKRTILWQNDLYGIDVIPCWLKDALINNLYPLVRNSMWIKDGRFAVSESFLDCPVTDTMVCRFYGSLAMAIMFPAQVNILSGIGFFTLSACPSRNTQFAASL